MPQSVCSGALFFYEIICLMTDKTLLQTEQNASGLSKKDILLIIKQHNK